MACRATKDTEPRGRWLSRTRPSDEDSYRSSHGGAPSRASDVVRLHPRKYERDGHERRPHHDRSSHHDRRSHHKRRSHHDRRSHDDRRSRRPPSSSPSGVDVRTRSHGHYYDDPTSPSGRDRRTHHLPSDVTYFSEADPSVIYAGGHPRTSVAKRECSMCFVMKASGLRKCLRGRCSRLRLVDALFLAGRLRRFFRRADDRFEAAMTREPPDRTPASRYGRRTKDFISRNFGPLMVRQPDPNVRRREGSGRHREGSGRHRDGGSRRPAGAPVVVETGPPMPPPEPDPPGGP